MLGIYSMQVQVNTGFIVCVSHISDIMLQLVSETKCDSVDRVFSVGFIY